MSLVGWFWLYIITALAILYGTFPNVINYHEIRGGQIKECFSKNIETCVFDVAVVKKYPEIVGSPVDKILVFSPINNRSHKVDYYQLDFCRYYLSYNRPSNYDEMNNLHNKWVGKELPCFKYNNDIQVCPRCPEADQFEQTNYPSASSLAFWLTVVVSMGVIVSICALIVEHLCL